MSEACPFRAMRTVFVGAQYSALGWADKQRLYPPSLSRANTMGVFTGTGQRECKDDMISRL